MPRPFVLPDVNDRSINNPTTIMSNKQVLGLYNQENPDDKKERVVDSVKEWFEEYALSEGWSSVDFSGSQAILTANVIIAQSNN
ncbi:hypothetical protein AB9L13_02085 [Desulfovibrio piger]|uniref:hypothetical protein n=1 Tax=uncultured Desulfovibrio sp. TaxID=167968 RepID=UPI00266F4117|nr:hypothetical protein [uncultured Desulfovibrio sp.]